jgi:hypothetical protein
MTTRRRYRWTLPAALPVTQAPNGAMRLNHLSAMHRDQVGRYLRCMAAGEDIATVAAECYEVEENREVEKP